MKHNLLRQLILAYVALSFYEPFWRLLVRGLMESNFEWSYAGIGGTGTSGDYWIIAVVAILGICMLFFGWRGRNRLVQWCIYLWVFVLFSSSLAIILSDANTKIYAETLHLELPYIWVIFPFDALFFILTTVWVFRQGKWSIGVKFRVSWNKVNSLLAILAVGLFPLEYFLLNGEEQHGLLDGVGIFVTLVQWVLINLTFYPWSAVHNNFTNSRIAKAR